jgi:tRNA nucleotidyltransferase/poly(A) polymerase
VSEAPGLALERLPAAAREVLGALHARAAGGAWLVGGAVRDALRGRPVGEVDVAVPAGALALARAVADALGAAYVALDEARGAARVMAACPLDLADWRAPDLDGDLRGRDFTVNALAVPLGPLLERGRAAVHDPTGGLADLGARRVRLCAPGALDDDPVRVLRAARLALEPGWDVDPALAAAAPRAAGRLGQVSAERRRDEVVAILQAPAGGRGLRRLDAWSAAGALLPEREAMRATAQPPPHRFDVWEHSLRAVEAADLLLAELDGLAPWGEELAAHLAAPVGDGLERRGLLRLAAWLHDIAKPETRTVIAGQVRFLGHDLIGAERAAAVADRLRLAGRARGILRRLVRHHLRCLHLAQAGAITPRARHRFHRDLGEDARDLLLLALCDAAAVRGEHPLDVWRGPGGAVVRTLLAGVPEAEAAAAAPPLLRGEDVMAAFGLPPGPEVGRLLRAAREAQALGLVHDRGAALEHLRRLGPGELDSPGTPP